MLDNLAEQVANLTVQVTSLTEATTRAEKLAEGNARVIQALANAAAEAQEERKQILQFMAQQQTEIVGLRTETRRLMEMWFEDRGRNEGEDNSPS
jgi:cell division septum initiation protein DivIVA